MQSNAEKSGRRWRGSRRNDLIAEPREPVEPPHRAAKSDSLSDSYTPERTWTKMNSIEQVNVFTRAQERVDAALQRPTPPQEHVCTPMWYSTLILALCTPAPLQLASQDSWTHEQTPQGMVWQRIWQYIALTSTFRRLANSVVHFLVERPQALHNEPMDGLLAWWAMISGRRTTFDHKHDRLIGATSRNEQTSPGRCPGLDPGAASWTS